MCRRPITEWLCSACPLDWYFVLCEGEVCLRRLKDWREMDIDEVFEELYNSVAQDEEIYEMDSVSGGSWNCSTVDYIMGRQNSTSSPQIALEMLTQFSKHSNTGFRSCKSENTSKDTKENILLVCKSKYGEDTKSSSETSHQEKLCAVEMQNYSDSYSTRCSDIEYGYETVDGYESGVTREQSDKRNLCKECRKLYKRARILKHTKEETPKKPAYSHWSSKFWMMMNRVPTQKRSNMKNQHRTLNSVVRKLRTSKQTINLSLRCCRLHSFLKRSLRLSTTAKKQFHSFNGRQKRKRPRSAQRSFQKSSSCSIVKKDTKKIYSFVLDSSEEEDTMLNVKRYKCLDETKERNCLQKQREKSPSPSMADIVAPINAWQEQNTSEHAAMDSPATQEEGLGTSSQSFNINPLDSDNSFDVASPPVFAHVQEGSFKELLQRMNLGYLRSGIVRENPI
ncbi:uncharacterized protein LOC120943825 [Rana temporaria]|uniref:uncharacterized protein LOC120943825 n=1 Tax=Rana temporaria TaxID=8407 RepID=UPI001AACE876|nr:uncharacterized protein LOC120943825 [Rana temporaria]